MEHSASGAHVSVLYQEVLSVLDLKPGGRHVDGTLGAGGHAAGILEATAPDGQLLGIDRDPQALQLAGQRLRIFGQRLTRKHGSFADLGQHLAEQQWSTVQTILLDLGLSSMQLDDGQRGFSFRSDAPLDMRFDPQQERTAGDLVNQLAEAELADLIFRYGDERKSRQIARAIVMHRPIHTTMQLARLIEGVLRRDRDKIHPATRTFQALRIAVNGELEAVERGLEQALEVLEPGGRLAVIAFHSLEDRIVKNFMRRESSDCICPPESPVCLCDHQPRLKLLTRRPIRPQPDEIEGNPRARSARLRAAEKLAPPGA